MVDLTRKLYSTVISTTFLTVNEKVDNHTYRSRTRQGLEKKLAGLSALTVDKLTDCPVPLAQTVLFVQFHEMVKTTDTLRWPGGGRLGWGLTCRIEIFDTVEHRLLKIPRKM
jgi:hypothetical protein